MKAAFDLDVPVGFTIRLVTETAGEMVLTLPSPRGELNDDELDSVSGAGFFDEFLSRFRPPIGYFIA